jgi:DNA-binding NarL/FixJ family response regulator
MHSILHFFQGICSKLRFWNNSITPSVRRAIENLPDAMPELRLDTTGRMEDVKLLICKGLRTKEIVDMLRVSIKTVENHKTALAD